MKKYFLFVTTLLLLAPMCGRGQALIALVFGKKVTSDRLEMGLVLGAQGSFIYGDASGMPKVGFAIGAYTDIKLWDEQRWSLCNYFVFKSPKGGTHIPRSMGIGVGEDPVLEGVTIKRSITYFEINPMMHCKLSPSWSIGAGPMAALRLIAKDTYTVDRTDDDGNVVGSLDYTYSVKSGIRPVDVGVAIDTEYRMMKGKGMRLNLRYAQGLINPYRPSTGLSGLNADVRLSLGIPIGARPKTVITNSRGTP